MGWELEYNVDSNFTYKIGFASMKKNVTINYD